MTVMNAPGVHRAGTLLAIGSAACFSLKAIFIKLAYPYGVDAVTLLCLRMLYALPVFAYVLWRTGLPSLDAADWVRMVALGLAGYYLSSLLDFEGLVYISAGLERLVLFSYPTLTVLLGMLVHRRGWDRQLTWPLLLCYAGIALAVMHDIDVGDSHRDTLYGTALVLGSALSFACYLSFGASMIHRIGAMRFTALSMVVATVGIVAHFAVTHPATSLLSLPTPVHGWTIVMAIVATILPVFMQTAAIARIGAEHMALIATIGPILTIAMSAAWLGEAVTPAQVAGAVLVILGVRGATRIRSAATPGNQTA
jgi:drug/metabolite transporter (DMT)-like permease